MAAGVAIVSSANEVWLVYGSTTVVLDVSLLAIVVKSTVGKKPLSIHTRFGKLEFDFDQFKFTQVKFQNFMRSRFINVEN